MPGDIVQADIAIITIFFDLMEYWPPDRHFACTVGKNEFIPCDYPLDPLRRKKSAMSFRDRSQVRDAGIQSRSNRALALAIGAVTSCAISVKQVASIERGN